MNISTNMKDATKDTYALIDTSFYIYRSIYSAMSEFQRTIGMHGIDESNLRDYDFSNNSEFMHLFKDRFIKSIKSISKQYFVPFPNLIFCNDCSKKNIWRKEYYPEYKLNRQVELKPADPNYSTVFSYCFNRIIPAICEKFNSESIGHYNCEGDDIIAILSKHLVDNRKKVLIFASDGDLKQLINNNNIKMITPNGVYDMSNIDYKQEKFIKVLSGDAKDNVPQIHNRCGRGTALKYYNNKDLLNRKIKSDPLIANKIKLNKILQLFESIPQKIEDEVTTSYIGERV